MDAVTSGGPGDQQRLVLTILYAFWVIVFAYSFVAYSFAPQEGPGFPDGLYKPMAFLGWQGLAGVFAIAVFGVSRAWPRGSSVRNISLGRCPTSHHLPAG